MDADLYLTIGLVLLAFALPPILGALNEGRAPRAASIVVLVGGTLVILALKDHQYTLDDIPHAFVRVVGRFIN
jgi:hypothetical protein